jgi:hypothetical protein
MIWQTSDDDRGYLFYGNQSTDQLVAATWRNGDARWPVGYNSLALLRHCLDPQPLPATSSRRFPEMTEDLYKRLSFREKKGVTGIDPMFTGSTGSTGPTVR